MFALDKRFGLFKFLSLLMILVSSLPASAQASEYSDIVRAVSKVEVVRKEHVVSTATGFFFKVGEQGYFVTNKHVVQPPDSPDPDHIKLLLHADLYKFIPNFPLLLPLYSKGGDRLWKEHPIADVDLVLLPLSEQSMTSFFVHWIKPEDFAASEVRVSAGDGVFVMGYPLGFFDEENNFPIFRHAMIASMYGVLFRKQRMCLIDGNLQHGMSGSPIFTEPTAMRVRLNGPPQISYDGFPPMLLGVLSQQQRPSSSSSDRKTPEDIGLCNCWYPSLLTEIAQQK
jgi:hypothetical protein